MLAKMAPARTDHSTDDMPCKWYRSNDKNVLDKTNTRHFAAVAPGNCIYKEAHMVQVANNFTTSNKSNICGEDFAQLASSLHREHSTAIAKNSIATNGGLVCKSSTDVVALVNNRCNKRNTLQRAPALACRGAEAQRSGSCDAVTTYDRLSNSLARGCPALFANGANQHLLGRPKQHPETEARPMPTLVA